MNVFNAANCPTCSQPLDVGPTRPEGEFKVIRRYSTGQPREGALYGACQACSALIEDVALMVEANESDRADVLAAIDGARRARAIFDGGRGDRRAAMTEFARAFHTLRRTSPPGIAPWDAPTLLEWMQQTPASTHTLNAAHFVLCVWNKSDMDEALGRPFDALSALVGWDRMQRAAFVEWARDPWWP